MNEPRRYRATIKPKPETPIYPTQVSIIQMVIDFTIGEEAPYDGPVLIIQEALRDLHLTGLMDVEYRKYEGGAGETIRPEDMPALPGSYADTKRNSIVTREPVTISNEHGSFTFIEGREYAIETMIPGVERKPRYSRMAFLGVKRGRGPKILQFSARGPDRTHSDQYGGTEEVHERAILAAVEVTRDEAARYDHLTREQAARYKVKPGPIKS